MTKFKPLPPLAALQEFLSYDPETGLFTWTKSRAQQKAGSVAGTLLRGGYIRVLFKRQKMLAHRLAWLFITKSDPGELTIDHIDGDKTNNRADNLRLATRNQQMWNREARGWAAVKNGRYRAEIRHNGELVRLGHHSSAEQARAAYVEACVKLRGEWAPNCYTDDVPQHQTHGNS